MAVTMEINFFVKSDPVDQPTGVDGKLRGVSIIISWNEEDFNKRKEANGKVISFECGNGIGDPVEHSITLEVTCT